MAGGYDNEDRLAEMEELRLEKEREALARLESRDKPSVADVAGEGRGADAPADKEDRRSFFRGSDDHDDE